VQLRDWYVQGAEVTVVLEYLYDFPQTYTVHVLLTFVRQFLVALAAIRRKGIVHMDLKPQNLMVDERGGLKLIDFGLAVLLGPTTKNLPLPARGTEGYIPLEVEDGVARGTASDIMAACYTIVELVCSHFIWRPLTLPSHSISI